MNGFLKVEVVVDSWTCHAVKSVGLCIVIAEVVGIVAQEYFFFQIWRQRLELFNSGVDTSVETLTVVENEFGVRPFFHPEKQIGVESGVGREKNSSVHKDSCAPGTFFPRRNTVGNMHCAEKLNVN